MVQSFNAHLFSPYFSSHQVPHLLYSCFTTPQTLPIPRIMHEHKDLAEIVFVISGSGKHQIGSGKYNTKPGDLLIYNAGVPHEEIAQTDSTLCVFCLGINNLHLKGRPENHFIPSDCTPVVPAQAQYDALHGLFQSLHTFVNSNQDSSGEVIYHLLQALIALVCELIDAQENPALAEDKAQESKIKAYIDQHYMQDDITLASIAQDMHMSPYYISHLFKQLEGISPMQYVIRRRIGEAQSLLINTHQSVTDIAIQVGYKNSNQFHPVFLRNVGLTPKNYRQYWTHKQNNI